jgi:aldehyde:ferredoxin oxidoreductase
VVTKSPLTGGIANSSVAEHIWDRGTEETEKIVLAKTDPYAHVAEIGPASENMVRVANVMTGGVTAARAAGRGGHGAVMGSKLVKAVAVKGTRGIQVANPEHLSTFSGSF